MKSIKNYFECRAKVQYSFASVKVVNTLTSSDEDDDDGDDDDDDDDGCMSSFSIYAQPTERRCVKWSIICGFINNKKYYSLVGRKIKIFITIKTINYYLEIPRRC